MRPLALAPAHQDRQSARHVLGMHPCPCGLAPHLLPRLVFCTEPRGLAGARQLACRLLGGSSGGGGLLLGLLLDLDLVQSLQQRSAVSRLLNTNQEKHKLPVAPGGLRAA